MTIQAQVGIDSSSYPFAREIRRAAADLDTNVRLAYQSDRARRRQLREPTLDRRDMVAVNLLFGIVPAGFIRGARVGLRDKLRNIGDYVRTRWKSRDPDSYHRYRAGRERERKQADHRREQAERSSERERAEVEREREYEERYAAERATEESRANVPHPDTSQSE